MFQQVKSHRQYQAGRPGLERSSPGRLRRLRLESMEGRLMLSTSAVEYAPPDIQPAQFFIEVSNSGSVDATDLRVFGIGSDVLRSNVVTDGGFISDFYVLPASPVDGDFVSSLKLRDSTTRYTVPGSHGTSVAGLLGSFLEAAAGDGIRPISFATRLTSAHPETTGATYVFSNIDYEPSPTQGGSIPIEPILAQLGPGRTLDAGASIAAQLRDSELSDTSSQPMAPLAAESELSGEWARAMILETAGGEPLGRYDDEPAHRHDEEWAPGHALQRHAKEPISASGLEREAEFSVARQSVGHRVAADIDYVSRAERRVDHSQNDTPIRLDSSNFLGHKRHEFNQHVDATFYAALYQGFSPAATSVPHAEAYAEVFDELGRDNAMVTRPIATSDKYTRGALVGLPLLTMLALERVAARNSRGSTKRHRIDIECPRPQLRRADGRRFAPRHAFPSRNA